MVAINFVIVYDAETYNYYYNCEVDVPTKARSDGDETSVYDHWQEELDQRSFVDYAIPHQMNLVKSESK